MYNWEGLTEVVTGRKPTMFLRDIQNNLEHIRKYKSALFIGGAGTIGLATIKQFLEWGCLDRIGILDQDENAMAEAIRSIRNRNPLVQIDVYVRDIRETNYPIYHQYHLVLYFAAMKHVRSERDLDTCTRMLDVNFTYMPFGLGRRFFYCSTDKAADPVSLLGASKRLGEAAALKQGGNAARFANVAFSNGSLLQSWLYRMADGHSLPVPRGVKRYLISPAESGRICMLAATWKTTGTVLFPLMHEETLLTDAAERFAKHFGYDRITYDECVTSGEKHQEIFYGHDEGILAAGVHLNRVFPSEDVDTEMDYHDSQSKSALLRAVADAVPNFRHRETGKSLDAKA